MHLKKILLATWSDSKKFYLVSQETFCIETTFLTILMEIGDRNIQTKKRK